MGEPDDETLQRIREQLRVRVAAGSLRITQHAAQAMAEEGITLDEVVEALTAGNVLEHYPEHRRGACCLVYGRSRGRRDLHIVCTTNQPILIVITVYEPRPPRWLTPTRRR